MTANSKALDVVAAAIAETEQALGGLNVFGQAVKDSHVTIARLTADNQRIRDNLDGLE